MSSTPRPAPEGRGPLVRGWIPMHVAVRVVHMGVKFWGGVERGIKTAPTVWEPGMHAARALLFSFLSPVYLQTANPAAARQKGWEDAQVEVPGEPAASQVEFNVFFFVCVSLSRISITLYVWLLLTDIAHPVPAERTRSFCCSETEKKNVQL